MVGNFDLLNCMQAGQTSDSMTGLFASGHFRWERADLLALVCDVELRFCNFPMWYPGSGVVLDCIDS